MFQPAVELNKDKMEKFRPELKKYYYDPARYKTYLEQLGIQYPTVKKLRIGMERGLGGSDRSIRI